MGKNKQPITKKIKNQIKDHTHRYNLRKRSNIIQYILQDY